jgi:hypothetical protein
MPPSSSTPLTVLNFLNVLAYIANVAVTYGIGVAGFAGTATNAELSAKYQTLVTPIGTAFAIWGIIFLAQLVFTIVQLFGPYRQAPLVAKGVGYYYIAACLSQIGWTVAFSFEIIWLSLVFMLSILFFLVSILISQYKAQETTSIKDYWLLKFPFAIHAGWIIAASFVNLSVVFVEYGIGPIIQYYTAFATIIVVLLIAALALGYPNRPEYVVPLVLSWASVSLQFTILRACVIQLSLIFLHWLLSFSSLFFTIKIGIYLELENPTDAIVATFGESRITDVKYAAIMASISIVLSVLLRAVMDYRTTKRSGGTSPDEDNVYHRHEDNGRTGLFARFGRKE